MLCSSWNHYAGVKGASIVIRALCGYVIISALVWVYELVSWVRLMVRFVTYMRAATLPSKQWFFYCARAKLAPSPWSTMWACHRSFEKPFLSQKIEGVLGTMKKRRRGILRGAIVSKSPSVLYCRNCISYWMGSQTTVERWAVLKKREPRLGWGVGRQLCAAVTVEGRVGKSKALLLTLG